MSINKLSALSYKTTNWNRMAPGTGGVINWSDVAAALNGADPAFVDLAMYLFLDDQLALRRLRVYLAKEVCHVLRKHFALLPVSDQQTVLGLTEAALQDTLRPERCPKCSCGGEAVIAGNRSTYVVRPSAEPRGSAEAGCPACSGSGIKQWSARRVAMMAGVTDRTFKRQWEPGYRAACRALCVCQSGLHLHLTTQLSPYH